MIDVMRVDFTPQSPQEWHQHFEASRGDVFVGDRYQRGGSLGSFLRGLLRFVLPMVKSAGGVVAKEALRTGAAIASDVAEGKPIGQAALTHATRGAENLADEAMGAASAELQRRKAQRGRGLGKRPTKSINTLAQPPQKKAKGKKKKQDVFGFF